MNIISEHQEKKPEIIKKKDYIFILILGILGTAIIKYKTDTLGLLSWVISIIAGILIILISILVLEDEDDEKSKKDHNHHKESHIKLNNKGIAFILISILAILALISLALSFFAKLLLLESFRIVFGSVYVLFLPGFIISYIFFPETKIETNYHDETDKGIDWLERIALSFALSIAVVPLVVFYLNLVGIKINFLNTFLTILGIIAVSLGILIAKGKKRLLLRKKISFIYNFL